MKSRKQQSKNGSKRRSNRNSSLLTQDGHIYSFNSVEPRQVDVSTKLVTVVLTSEDFTVLSTSITVPVNTSKQYTLADFTGYTDLINAFDQYRFVSIEAYITPTGSIPSTNDGKLTTVVDFDDATALSGSAALAYSNAVTSPGMACQYRHFKPHVAQALYGGSVFTSFGNLTSPWIDAGSVGVPHYGIKLFSTVTAAVRAYDLTSRAVIQFRNTR